MYLLRAPIRDYAWGSATLLAGLQDRVPTGRPEAELWMGAHPGAPAGAVPADDPQAEPVPLDELLAADPARLLGPAAGFGRLPYLVKLLAAGQPLSIQAHPTLDQARAGYAAEEAAGVDASAPHRNYKDDNHKPEMVVALTPFSALCGFRAAEDAGASFARLAAALAENHQDTAETLTTADTAQDAGHAGSPEAPSGSVSGALARTVAGYAELLRGSGPASDAAEEAAADSAAIESVFCDLLDPTGPWASGTWVEAVVGVLTAAQAVLTEDLNLATAVGIADHHPRDPGVLVSVLLNRVDLAPGQAVHLPAGNVHAYLYGLGVEVMASSDNVLRGGLTPKHVDIPELRTVVAFESMPVPYCEPVSDAPGHQLFRPPFDEFQVERWDLPAAEGRALTANGPVVAVCTAGTVRLRAGGQSADLSPGQSVFLGADEAAATVHGTEDATLFSITLPA